jgi:ubiquinone/menaquinone biosynthesis C-methylase UbiE
MRYTRKQLKTYLQWDEMAWGECLYLFQDMVKKYEITKGLEIAANKGGMSLFFANELGVVMECTDLSNPENSSREAMKNLKDPGKVSFRALNALEMDLPDNSVDMLIFKSFLGGMITFEKQQKAMKEVYRVLKPGGILLFAENLTGSWLHKMARNSFVKWGAKWRYVNLKELESFTSKFSVTRIRTFGFFSIFAKVDFLRPLFYNLDKAFKYLFPRRSRYIAYGFAIK